MEGIEVRKLFAENLKTFRKQKGLSQLKLANEVQMAFTFINDIENCKKWVSPETIARLATFFDVPPAAFFASKKDASFASARKIDFFAKTILEEVSKTILKAAQRFK